MSKSTLSSHQTLFARAPRPQRRTLPLIVVGAAVVAALIRGFLYWRDLPPDMQIPTHAVPAENARDFFIKAAALEKDRERVDAIYSGAQSLANNQYLLAAKRDIVQRNASALSVLRKGLQLPYEAPPCRSDSFSLEPYEGFRRLARLLALGSQVDSASGQYEEAVTAALDCAQMGTMIPRGGVLMTGLVGRANESIGLRQLARLIPELGPVEARQAADWLQDLISAHTPFTEVLQEEDYFGESVMLQLFNRRGWRSAAGASDPNPILPDPPPSLKNGVLLQLLSKRQILHDYQSVMSRLIADAGQPYPLRRTAKQIAAPIAFDTVARVNMDIMAGRFMDVRTSANEQLTLARLAVRAYTCDHNQPPSHLQDLIPTYLRTVPQDPFAVNQPLRYRVETGQPVIYSIGPDGKDDGGHRVLPYNKITAESKGDILAGLSQ